MCIMTHQTSITIKNKYYNIYEHISKINYLDNIYEHIFLKYLENCF